jgi:hypothetical protein
MDGITFWDSNLFCNAIFGVPDRHDIVFVEAISPVHALGLPIRIIGIT